MDCLSANLIMSTAIRLADHLLGESVLSQSVSSDTFIVVPYPSAAVDDSAFSCTLVAPWYSRVFLVAWLTFEAISCVFLASSVSSRVKARVLDEILRGEFDDFDDCSDVEPRGNGDVLLLLCCAGPYTSGARAHGLSLTRCNCVCATCRASASRARSLIGDG